MTQTRRLFLIGGRGRLAEVADRVATAGFRWVYTRAPLAPRAMSKVARANGAPPLRTVVSLLTADENLVTEMPWELDGFDLPQGFRRVGPIFAHIDAPLPEIVERMAAAPEPLVYLGGLARRRIGSSP